MAEKEKHKKPTSSSPSFFTTPRLFTNFTSSKGFHPETESASMMSPTSILDSKPFSAFKNPFWSETSSPRTPGSGEHKRCWDKFDSRGVGLGLIDALIDDEKHDEVASKQENRTVLFGSQLKIQIPALSKTDFGTRATVVDSSEFSSSSSSSSSSESQRVFFKGCLSASELEVMELSEDYTRVISHGPNPRTTHIYGNCIIGSVGCSDSAAADSSAKVDDDYNDDDDHALYPSHTFLSFCFYCNKNLGQGKDIYMFRGERAFCSHECRYQGMLLEEGMSKLEADDVFGT